MKTRILTVALVFLAPSVGWPFDILFDGESPYHHVRVTEDEGYRFLSFDETRGTQSAMKLSDPLFLEYVYTQLAFAGLAFCGDPKEAVFVGLGGASMPRFLRHHYPETNIDIAEIDPLVVDVAKKFFQFAEDKRMRVHQVDGRVFLSKSKKQYDLIFLDAYNTRSIPFHLTTKEFMEIVRSRLKPDGAVVSNIWSPSLNRYFEAEIKTFQATFPELYMFQGLNSGNWIFVATAQKGQVPVGVLVERARKIMLERKFHFDLPDLIRSTYQYETDRSTKATVLTDDHAPVDELRRREVEKEPGQE